jgi:acyl carrier protein
MQQKLLNIFREVFNDPDLEVNENTTAADVPGWDSFNHMNLVMYIEEEFSVSFSTREIGQMARVGDLMQLLQQKLS